MKSNVYERRGKISDLDRSFDFEYWQAQTPQARYEAAWELIIHAAKVQGLDVRQLRLQRSDENYQKQPNRISGIEEK